MGGLNFTNRSQLKLKAQARSGKYAIRLVDHVAALEDEATVYAATLVLFCALAESAALDKLGLDSRDVAGVEDWGARLLRSASARWSAVEGGLAGAVEVGVVRSLVAHGTNAFDRCSRERLVKVGHTAFSVGQQVVLDYERVGLYRSRLRRMLITGGLGRAIT